MTSRYRCSPKSAFTLIELSIVLVIIGLIVGGVLVGKDLIRAAEIRATVADVEKLETAIRTFQGKYNCLPGDCPNATDYFGTSTDCNQTSMTPGRLDGSCNGNGDGNYLPWALESGLAVDHLIRAQFIPQNFIPLTGATLALRVPSNQALSASYIFTNDLYNGVNIGGDAAINGHYGNTVTLGAKSGGCVAGAIINVRDAQQIDTKMDDGHASGGNVYGLTGGQPGMDFGGSTCGPPLLTCLDAGGDYNVNETNSNGACRMLFYWQ